MLRKKNCCFNIPKQQSTKLEIENEFAFAFGDKLRKHIEEKKRTITQHHHTLFIFCRMLQVYYTYSIANSLNI